MCKIERIDFQDAYRYDGTLRIVSYSSENVLKYYSWLLLLLFCVIL